jgi:hypothetical protein
VRGLKRSNLRKGTLNLKIQLFVLTKKLANQLILIAKGILKFGDSQRKTFGRLVITYIGVRVGDVTLALGPLILLGAGGVIAGEVEVTEGGTRSGHHLQELLLLVPEAVLFLALALVTGVVLIVVVVLVGGVELLPLGAVGDKVDGVITLEAVPRRSLTLLAEHVQSSELSR